MKQFVWVSFLFACGHPAEVAPIGPPGSSVDIKAAAGACELVVTTKVSSDPADLEGSVLLRDRRTFKFDDQRQLQTAFDDAMKAANTVDHRSWTIDFSYRAADHLAGYHLETDTGESRQVDFDEPQNPLHDQLKRVQPQVQTLVTSYDNRYVSGGLTSTRLTTDGELWEQLDWAHYDADLWELTTTYPRLALTQRLLYRVRDGVVTEKLGQGDGGQWQPLDPPIDPAFQETASHLDKYGRPTLSQTASGETTANHYDDSCGGIAVPDVFFEPGPYLTWAGLKPISMTARPLPQH
jgi:hypothetical protein